MCLGRHKTSIRSLELLVYKQIVTGKQFTSQSRESFSITDDLYHKRYFQLDNAFYRNAPFNKANLLYDCVKYDKQEKRLYKHANIISISQKNTGNGIERGTFKLGSYVDDKHGNLMESSIYSSGKYPKDTERVFF